jgi:hypothetical protein
LANKKEKKRGGHGEGKGKRGKGTRKIRECRRLEEKKEGNDPKKKINKSNECGRGLGERGYKRKKR